VIFLKRLFKEKSVVCGNNETFLCYVAATNFDAVIDDTQQLSVRRGASIFMREVVRRLPEWLEAEGFSCTEVSSGASIGIYEVEALDRQGLERTICQLLCNGPKAPTGDPHGFDFSNVRFFTFSVAIRRVEKSELESSFPVLVEALAAEAAFRQMQALSLSLEGVAFGPKNLPNGGRYACEWDGIRPATENLERSEDGKWQCYSLSSSVYNRYYGGRRCQGREDERGTLSDLKKNFILHETDNQCDHSYVFDLEQLTGFDPGKKPFKNFSNLMGKMAVIHVDGNGFGKVKTELKSKKDYSDFDRFLQGKRRRFLIELFDIWAQEEAFVNIVEGKSLCRFELLQWGGDEMLFIVPAWMGFPILQLFFDCSYPWKGSSLTHSAGMVLCSHKTPIARAQRLAEELSDWCKHHSQGENLYATLILESIDYPTQPLEQFFSLRFGLLADHAYPASPYSGDWLDLMERVAELKEGLPRSRIHEELLSLMEELEHAGGCNAAEVQRDSLRNSAERLQQLAESDTALRDAFEAWCQAWPCRDLRWLGGSRLPYERRDPPPEVLEEAQRIWRWVHLLEQWDYLLTRKELGLKRGAQW